MNMPTYLLLLSSLCSITFGVIYNVIPDRPGWKNQCHNCKTLAQIIDNAKQYLKLNAELRFQPGKFVISSSFELRDAKNISFIGACIYYI